MATDLAAMQARTTMFMEYIAQARASLGSGIDEASRDRESFARGDLTIEQFEVRVQARLRREMEREKRGEGVA